MASELHDGVEQGRPLSGSGAKEPFDAEKPQGELPHAAAEAPFSPREVHGFAVCSDIPTQFTRPPLY